MPSPPCQEVPADACDTHTHVFGPFDRFPMAYPPAYPAPLAPAPIHRAMVRAAGLRRSVLVQPSPYGTDASALLAALREGEGNLRGVAAAMPDIADAALMEMHAAGVRGLRFTAMTDPVTGGLLKGAVGFDRLAPLAPRIAALGWHAQLWGRASQLASAVPELLELGIPLVIEHMGWLDIQLDSQRGVESAEFGAVCEFLKTGQVWVKLVLCRNSRNYPLYSDLRKFHDRLISINPDRLLWGSDWPYVRMGEDAPDVGRLLDVFHDWVPDVTIRRKILSDNPAALYRFSEEERSS
jgi:2-pyrone-4,6-dicarboxylate lactonase